MIVSTGKRQAVYAFSDETYQPIDVYKEMKKSGSIEQHNDTMTLKKHGLNVPLDFHAWLPRAAPHYHLSPNFDDYVITPVIIMPSDLPNRNSVAFPLSELVAFHPNLGQLAYKTWKGKPTFYEHQNEDITKAYGIIADSYLRKMSSYGSNRIYKILVLLTYDRTKHPDIVLRIINGDLNTYSMGAYIEGYTCSLCGEEVGNCYHIDPKQPTNMYEIGNKLVFRNVRGIEGFETSAVESPAYVSAISDTLIHVRP